MAKRTRAEIQAEIDDRKRQLGKRRGKPGFSANVADLEARLAELDAELAAADD